MRQEIIANLVRMLTVVFWLAVLIIHFVIQHIKKRIVSACAIDEVVYFRCDAVTDYIKASKNLRKMILACLVVVSIVMVVEIALKSMASAGFNDSAVGLTNLNVLFVWLICVGGYLTSMSFLKLFLALQKKCDELSRGH